MHTTEPYLESVRRQGADPPHVSGTPVPTPAPTEERPTVHESRWLASRRARLTVRNAERRQAEPLSVRPLPPLG